MATVGCNHGKVVGGVRLSANSDRVARFEADLSGMPDVALPVIVACCLSDTPFHLTGLDTLYIKECDRVMAVTREAGKLGYGLQIPRTWRVVLGSCAECMYDVGDRYLPGSPDGNGLCARRVRYCGLIVRMMWFLSRFPGFLGTI